MSSAIVPSAGNAFAQQGTVDWTSLSGSTVNFTVEVLARLSKAGVEPLTVAMGQAICSGFRLDADGEKRFSDTIARLKAFSSYGNVMWFGFGVKHIVRTLSETEQGATCAAICACLSVSYDKFFCSKVLKSLADQQRAPNTLMPSLSQWMALVDICNGAVLGSRFPQLVGVYSRLTQSCDGTRRRLREPTSADALATALAELSEVSSGMVRSITFIGGVDCGWLAALAQWLLSLRVDIVAADGSVLYSSKTSANPSEYPQVTIILQSDQNGQISTSLLKKSVLVPPGSSFFNIRKEKFNGQSHSFVAGRSDWSTVLNDAFGIDFDWLLDQRLIQSFARLLCHGFVPKSEDNRRHIDPWGGLSMTSVERQLSYLSFAAQRLPELVPVCNIAKKMVHNQEISAGMQTNFPEEFQRYCSCTECKSARDSSFRPTIKMAKANKAICLNRVALTIFEYIWTLSWLDIDEDIYPSANGLVLLSRNQETYNDDTARSIKDRLFERPLMPIIIQLFTGQLKVSAYMDSTVSARSKGGVCVYLPSLKNPNSSPQEQLRAVVVAGHIEWGNKLFSRVVDGRKKGILGLPSVYPSTVAQAYGTHVELKLVIEETFDSEILVADFWVSNVSTEPLRCISYHTGHIDYSRATKDNSSDYKVGHCFGATKIRSAITKLILPSNCYSRSAELQALSIDGPVSWNGTCCEAAASLWVDSSNQKCYSPTSEEWVLIARSDCCQEIVRGTYKLLYSIMCNAGKKTGLRLSSGTCILCTLGTHRNATIALEGNDESHLSKPQTRSWKANSTVCDLGFVATHSFDSSGPSSRVLLSSAILFPVPQNAQLASEESYVGFRVGQVLERTFGAFSKISQPVPPTSQVSPIPSKSGSAISDDSQPLGFYRHTPERGYESYGNSADEGDDYYDSDYSHHSHAVQLQDRIALRVKK